MAHGDMGAGTRDAGPEGGRRIAAFLTWHMARGMENEGGVHAGRGTKDVGRWISQPIEGCVPHAEACLPIPLPSGNPL